MRRLTTIALLAGVMPMLTRAAMAEEQPGAIRDININVTHTAPSETGSIDGDADIDPATGYLKLGEGLQLSAPPPAVSSTPKADEPKSKPSKPAGANAKPAKPQKRTTAPRPTRAAIKPAAKKRDTEISSRLINRALDSNTNITEIGPPDPE